MLKLIQYENSFRKLYSLAFNFPINAEWGINIVYKRQNNLRHCEDNHTDTLTIIDSVVLSDTFLTEGMLTAHAWKIFEVRAVLEGTPLYYLRGGLANTQSFDNESLTFNADHTGLVVDNALANHVMTAWGFSNPEHTKLVFTLSNYGTVYSDYTYDNIRYKNGNLYYDCYYKDNLTGGYYHGQEIRIPK